MDIYLVTCMRRWRGVGATFRIRHQGKKRSEGSAKVRRFPLAALQNGIGSILLTTLCLLRVGNQWALQKRRSPYIERLHMAILSGDDATKEPQLEKVWTRGKARTSYSCRILLTTIQARHIKYWTRCLKTFLPQQYTGNDSNRMYLAFFIVAALDLLGVLDAVPTAEERRDYVNWIYRCQHPNGGFRMWPGTDFGERTTSENAKWDPSNVPATYFALACLLIFNDDFQRVKRRETLVWLNQMQRPDGSFGETLVNGRIEGGRDPRFGYCATGIRHILRGVNEGDANIDGHKVRDIDVDAFVRCVEAAEVGTLAKSRLHPLKSELIQPRRLSTGGSPTSPSMNRMPATLSARLGL